MDYHLHASVSENSYYTDRRECFTGPDGLSGARNWLLGEIGNDWLVTRRDLKEGSYEDCVNSVEAWDGTTEAIEAEVTIPHPTRDGYGVIIGYRIMHIDGPCEEML